MFVFVFLHYLDVVRQKGLEHITVDDLVTEITPKGRGLFVDNYKNNCNPSGNNSTASTTCFDSLFVMLYMIFY